MELKRVLREEASIPQTLSANLETNSVCVRVYNVGFYIVTKNRENIDFISIVRA